jgi:hypothetical protein
VVVAEVVAGDGSQVVWLAGVGVAVVARQQDALALQVSNAAIDGDFGVVLGRNGGQLWSFLRRSRSGRLPGSRARW